MKRSTLNRGLLALRTTTRPQGRHAILRSGRYCANGILALEFGGVDYFDTHTPYRAIRLLEGLGFPFTEISLLNDGTRATFANIADWLDANIEVTDEDTVPDHVPAEWDLLPA